MFKYLTPETRLNRIKEIIDTIDDRRLAAEKPWSDVRQEMTIKELQEIYTLAGGKIG